MPLNGAGRQTIGINRFSGRDDLHRRHAAELSRLAIIGGQIAEQFLESRGIAPCKSFERSIPEMLNEERIGLARLQGRLLLPHTSTNLRLTKLLRFDGEHRT